MRCYNTTLRSKIDDRCHSWHWLSCENPSCLPYMSCCKWPTRNRPIEEVLCAPAAGCQRSRGEYIMPTNIHLAGSYRLLPIVPGEAGVASSLRK